MYRPCILLIENDEGIYHSLNELFRDEYEVYWAPNGKKAMDFVQEDRKKIFLIILDIYLEPENGLHVMSKINGIKRILNIPIIIYTGRDSIKIQDIAPFTGTIYKVFKKPADTHEFQMWVRFVITKTIKQDIEQEISIPVCKALAYISENFMHGELSVEEITEASGAALRKLQVLFREQLKTGIQEFLQGYRIKQAAVLLKRGEIKVIDAAYDVGINSSAYFVQLFKKKYGVAPLQYKKQHQGEFRDVDEIINDHYMTDIEYNIYRRSFIKNSGREGEDIFEVNGL